MTLFQNFVLNFVEMGKSILMNVMTITMLMGMDAQWIAKLNLGIVVEEDLLIIKMFVLLMFLTKFLFLNQAKFGIKQRLFSMFNLITFLNNSYNQLNVMTVAVMSS